MSKVVQKGNVEKKKKEPPEPKKRFVPIHYTKYRLYEAVTIDGVPYFLSYSPTKGFSVITSIPRWDGKVEFFPRTGKESVPYKPYDFDEMPRRSMLRPYPEIYDMVYREFDTFIVSPSVYKHKFTSFTNLSYRQRLFDCLPYLYLLGLTDSGKTTVLRLISFLGYRPLFGVSFPSADIFTYLGMGEGGDSLILEDEVQGLENDREKLKIYKSGNLKGGRVPRMMKDIRKILYYNTFGLKGFGAEKTVKDRGFMRRCSVVRMIKAKPKRKLTKATEEDHRRFKELRNQLLLWRLAETVDMTPLDIPETGLNDLWEPILYLAKGTPGYQPLRELFGRKSVKAIQSDRQTLEGYISQSLKKRTENLEAQKGRYFIPFEGVWGTLMEEIDGVSIPNRPYTMYSDQLGEITKHSVGGILKDIFEGEVKARKVGGVTKKVYSFRDVHLQELFERYEKVTEVTELLIAGGVLRGLEEEGMGIEGAVTLPPTVPINSNSVTRLPISEVIEVIVNWLDNTSLHGKEDVSVEPFLSKLRELCKGDKAKMKKVCHELVKQRRVRYDKATKTLLFHPPTELDRVFDQYETGD